MVGSFAPWSAGVSTRIGVFTCSAERLRQSWLNSYAEPLQPHPPRFAGKQLFGITRRQQLLGMTQQHLDGRLDAVHSSLERGSRIELTPNADARKCKMI